MKKMFSIFVIVASLTLISACFFASTNSTSSNNVSPLDTVTLTFVQHTFVTYSYNENKEINGYYFENDELAKTSIKFKKGYNLSFEDINNFDSSSLNYVVPSLVGDGYWSFTFFTTSFDENSGYSSNYLKPCILDNDLLIHFAIYG